MVLHECRNMSYNALKVDGEYIFMMSRNHHELLSAWLNACCSAKWKPSTIRDAWSFYIMTQARHYQITAYIPRKRNALICHETLGDKNMIMISTAWYQQRGIRRLSRFRWHRLFRWAISAPISMRNDSSCECRQEIIVKRRFSKTHRQYLYPALLSNAG